MNYSITSPAIIKAREEQAKAEQADSLAKEVNRLCKETIRIGEALSRVINRVASIEKRLQDAHVPTSRDSGQ